MEIEGKHVAIVGLGPSINSYVGYARKLGGRWKYSDLVWGINALGNVLDLDLLFHMDDVRIQEIRAAANPHSNIAAMLSWLGESRVPVMTSRKHADYPALVEFPLAEVLTEFPCGYFNSTAAYAVAYAVYGRARKISCFGMDFTYPDAHDAERGRACVEFWLGIAHARGIEICLPQVTSLMDACYKPEGRFYGYDCVELAFSRQDGRIVVDFKERDTLPTAGEIEADYDHDQHPNPLVGERQVAPDVSGIRFDHVARYEFAAHLFRSGTRVVDFACGVGYGTCLLARAGHRVLGLDRDEGALEYARSFYGHANVRYARAEANSLAIDEPFDAAVCFETIEHIEDPGQMLRALRGAAPLLVASVPNEAVFPWRGYAFHYRHYTRREFQDLLTECGWKVTAWYGQKGPESGVEPDIEGRTLIAVAERTDP